MREILFKAKRTENGEWIEGYYYKVQETVHCFNEDYEKNPVPIHHFIIFTRTTDWELPMEVYQTEIIPETLCQFTGLTDKNGKRIWENDIVNTDSNVRVQIKFGLYSNGFSTWKHNQGFYMDFMDKEYYRPELGYWAKKTAVIGNIFDNPELLQEKINE